MNMIRKINKIFATKKTKVYYDIENEFVAVGERYLTYDKYYTAVHAKGLWICDIVSGSKFPVIIGLVPWDNISRILVDHESMCVYVEVKDFQSILDGANMFFKIYKKKFTRRMSDTGQMALRIPITNFGDVWDYIQDKNIVPIEDCEEKITVSEKVGIFINELLVIVVILIFASLVALLGYVIGYRLVKSI